MANDLFVVIATAGRPGLLRRTLASLEATQKPDTYRETIVVENGSKAGAEAVVYLFRSSLGARYLHVSERNKSHALNTVLGMIGECLIFFTDDDVRLHPNTLRAYEEAARSIDSGKFYGGPVSVDYEREPVNWLINYLPPSVRGWQLTAGVESVPRAGYFLGCNWAAFAKDLRTAGGFDVHRGPGAVTGSLGQETEMQRRLLRKGLEGLYVPEAMVWHYVPGYQCSAKWVAGWAYRDGIKRGMDYTRQMPTILGFPRWMIREWLKRGFKVLIQSASKGRTTRFEAYHKFCFFSGYMKGSRIARRNSSYVK